MIRGQEGGEGMNGVYDSDIKCVQTSDRATTVFKTRLQI